MRKIAHILLMFSLIVAGTAAALVLQLSGDSPAASAGSLPADSSSRVVRSTFWSASLGREMPYEVYLPQGYDSGTTARYPVLYMLHGASGDNSEWATIGIVNWTDQLTLLWRDQTEARCAPRAAAQVGTGMRV